MPKPLQCKEMICNMLREYLESQIKNDNIGHTGFSRALKHYDDGHFIEPSLTLQSHTWNTLPGQCHPFPWLQTPIYPSTVSSSQASLSASGSSSHTAVPQVLIPLCLNSKSLFFSPNCLFHLYPQCWFMISWSFQFSKPEDRLIQDTSFSFPNPPLPIKSF